MRMPFGKHRGEKIEDLPSDYLRWMKNEMDDEELKEAAEEEYSQREDEGTHFWSNE
ncbi:hypothetical protein LCGC14_1352090 [marine sediment metagenome]|uniref:Quorum-sensing-regulated virulence factor n=1 Tax=marine sediment metagenome TaxID=412755 RepID=A0A0F9KWN9_9ZZZZ